MNKKIRNDYQRIEDQDGRYDGDEDHYMVKNIGNISFVP